MRKLLVLLLSVVSLAIASALVGSARSATTAAATVTITKTGYNPTAVSIVAGEAVAFANKDTVAHTVDFKSTIGMHCSSAIPLVIQPAQSASCTFANTGKFAFSDPANKGRKFRGTVTVATPLTSSFKAPAKIVYGRKATLTGTLVSKQAGVSLQVFAQQCGTTKATQIATVTSGTGGTFSYAAQPLLRTTYTIKSHNLSSSAATVRVVPNLRLSRAGKHRYVVRLSAAQSFAGKNVSFQRFRPTVQRWRGVKQVLLHTNSTGIAPTVVSSAKFRSGLRRGLRVRVALTQKQAGACYAAGHSNTIRTR